jgi:WhiB family redox-sensing transcriptional regulator
MAARYPNTLPNALSWADDAACRNYDVDEFFTESKTGVAMAKGVCARCPVSAECLDEALRAEDGSRYGIYGGLTGGERDELVRNGLPKRPRTGGGKPPAPCGTRSAYDRHKRLGEPVDAACEQSYDDYRRWRRKSVH